jgi:hypothetical protein
LNNPELTLISNIVLKIVAPIYVLYYHRKRSSPNCKLVGEEFAAIFNDFVKSKIVAVESLIVSNINPVIVGVCISNF